MVRRLHHRFSVHSLIIQDQFNELQHVRIYIMTVSFYDADLCSWISSVYANGLEQFGEVFGISLQADRVGQMIYLIMYAIGCE